MTSTNGLTSRDMLAFSELLIKANRENLDLMTKSIEEQIQKRKIQLNTIYGFRSKME